VAHLRILEESAIHISGEVGFGGEGGVAWYEIKHVLLERKEQKQSRIDGL
jgi:hypothetical protein